MHYYIISLHDRFKQNKGTTDEPNYKQIYNSANKQYKIRMRGKYACKWKQNYIKQS